MREGGKPSCTHCKKRGHDDEHYCSHASSSSNNESHDDERKRNELFHIRVVSKHTKIDTLFDLGSHVNLISEELLKKMGLETKPHTKPYPLGWVCDEEKLNVTKQCRIIFSIASKLIDEVDLYHLINVA